MSRYDRSVNAALSETASKFKLAEALALDIPAQQGKEGVTSQLEEIREAIIEAGGEPRAVNTLSNYRKTALHFDRNAGEVEWAEGYSFTAHMDAYYTGIHPDQFRANPQTAREIRQENGGASKDGAPKAVIAGWSPEQKEEALNELREDALQAIVQEQDRRRAAVKPKTGEKAPTKAEVNQRKVLDLAMAEIMHFSRSTIQRAEAATKQFEAAMPNPFWNEYLPGETVHRTHEERVLGDLDRADEAIQKARIAIAKVIDKVGANAEA